MTVGLSATISFINLHPSKTEFPVTWISIRGIGTEIDHNTVILGGNYPGAVEVQNSSGLLIRNNLLTQPVWNRGDADYSAQGNKTDATNSDLAQPGLPHLNPDSSAVDFPGTISLPSVSSDIDGDQRPEGDRPDAGCDEIGALNWLIFLDGFESGDIGQWVS